MWPIVLCKLLKIKTIHLGDAQTTTCVNLVNRLSTQGSSEEGRYENGRGKEQGSENEGGAGRKACEQSLHVVILPSCNYHIDHLSTRPDILASKDWNVNIM